MITLNRTFTSNFLSAKQEVEFINKLRIADENISVTTKEWGNYYSDYRKFDGVVSPHKFDTWKEGKILKDVEARNMKEYYQLQIAVSALPSLNSNYLKVGNYFFLTKGHAINLETGASLVYANYPTSKMSVVNYKTGKNVVDLQWFQSFHYSEVLIKISDIAPSGVVVFRVVTNFLD